MSKKRIQLENRKEVLERLQEARKDSGLSQAEVANYIGISQASYGRWENGVDELPIGALPKIADLFDLSIDWLITGEEFLSLDQTIQPCPPPGEDLISLPPNDPEPLSGYERAKLEGVLIGIRLTGEPPGQKVMGEHQRGTTGEGMDGASDLDGGEPLKNAG